MLNDSAPTVVLVDGVGHAALGELARGTVVDVRDDGEMGARVGREPRSSSGGGGRARILRT